MDSKIGGKGQPGDEQRNNAGEKNEWRGSEGQG